MTDHFYCGLCSGMCIGTRKIDTSPRGLSLGNILENYPVILWVPSEEKSKSNKSLGHKTFFHKKSICDAIRSTSGASQPPINSRMRRTEGTCIKSDRKDGPMIYFLTFYDFKIILFLSEG